MFRAARAVVVPRVVRAFVALRDFVAPRAAVAGRVPVRDDTDCDVVARVVVATRGATVFVAVRTATFFVAVRGSGVAIVAVRAFVPPVREFGFCDCVIVFVPRAGVVDETFCADARDAARAISS